MKSGPHLGNVADRLEAVAKQRRDQVAIAVPQGSHRQGVRRTYSTTSFKDLFERSSTLAVGMQEMGIGPGKKIALLVRFGEDFITLVFALLKTGATLVLVDPGMGRKNLLNCLEAVEPDGFVAIPQAHAIRVLLRNRFPKAKLNVMVGMDFGLFGIPNLARLEHASMRSWTDPSVSEESDAAIIYTTGSTGPPKGVLYSHSTFHHQIDQLIEQYRIAPGGCDLSAFPLFGLFNAVMGTTTIIPDMDPTRPADIDPVRLLDAIDQWNIRQAFGSPALWTRFGKYCEEHHRKAESLRLILSAGAPVAPRVLEWMRAATHEETLMFTPYGATEALPIASIESREVLGETAALCRQGKGTCVGQKFSGIDWRVIAIDDGPLTDVASTRPVPLGQIGELMVRGPVVTKRYVTRTDQNSLHKVVDGSTIWHRMGDVGYLDEKGRFWFCGRKSHRVTMAGGDLFTEPCEAIINTHPSIYRSALVGAGSRGSQSPILVVEPWPEMRPKSEAAKSQLTSELQNLAQSNPITSSIERCLVYPTRLPTDIRHNSKIFREKLAPWAEQQIQ